MLLRASLRLLSRSFEQQFKFADSRFGFHLLGGEGSSVSVLREGIE